MTYTQDTTPARAEAQDEGAAGERVEDLWQELCERDDRTSPDEYPEMCLITFDELSDFITRAHPSPTPAADADRVRDLVAAAEGAQSVLNAVAAERRKVGPIATKAQSLVWQLKAALAALKSEGKA